MTNKNAVDFIIVGAGIGGLSLGYFLKRAGFRVVILESSAQVGGAIQTLDQQGFLLEMGPRSVYERPAFCQLVNKLSLDDELIYPSTNGLHRLIGVKNGRGESATLFPLPQTIAEVFYSPLFSLLAKSRILVEPFISQMSCEDQDVRTFLETRFGREVSELASAVLSGIWASDISSQSARSTLPLLWSYREKYGSLLQGVLRDSRQRKRQRPKAVSFRSGMSILPLVLQEALRDEIICNSRTVHIGLERDFEGSNVRVTTSSVSHRHGTVSLLGAITKARTYFAKSVILTTPAYVTGQLVSPFAPALGKQILNLPYAPVGLLYLAVARKNLEHVSLASGFLVPPAQGQALLGATFDSQVFLGRAPEGYELITCYSGGANNPELSQVMKEEVRAKIIAELTRLIGFKERPTVLHQKYLKAAVPSYPVRHFRLQAALRNFTKVFPQIRILANWVQGMGVGHRIEEAEKLSHVLIGQAEAGVPRQATSRVA